MPNIVDFNGYFEQNIVRVFKPLAEQKSLREIEGIGFGPPPKSANGVLRSDNQNRERNEPGAEFSWTWFLFFLMPQGLDRRACAILDKAAFRSYIALNNTRNSRITRCQRRTPYEPG